MFNKDFYPTPNNLIEKMLDGIDWKNNYQPLNILEPSAGKGDIVDFIKAECNKCSSNYYKINPDIDCIEYESDLQKILKGKGYRIIHDNFLTFNTMKRYDLIVMNPPFSNGAKHLFKAIDLMKDGGYIICLLNAETIKNQCSNDRIKLSRLLEDYNADVQFIENGFSNAERKTDVEIALIKIHIPNKENISFIWNDTLKKAEEHETYHENDTYYLADNDFFKAIVNQYNIEVESGIKLINEFKAMMKYIGTEFNEDGTQSGTILKMTLHSNRDNLNIIPSINDFIKEVRYKYWKTLFNNPKFIGQLTDNLRKDFYNRLKELRDYDFNLYNIYQLKHDMSSQVISGIEETILELFDDLSHKYSYYDTSANIHMYNGWKTNKAYMINKKVIIPLNMFENTYTWSSGEFNPFRWQGENSGLNKLKDIEKVFNYLDGGLTDAIDMEEQLKKAVADGQTKNIDLKYFKITFYKKGTAHITFKNDDLLKKFNIFGSQKKGWLPDDYGKKSYDDMSDEEKAVIDDFEGSKSYSRTLNNVNYFITTSNSLLMIEDKDN